MTSATAAAPAANGKTSPLEKLSNRIFAAVHGNNLVYNTCWEDPALDRVALQFGPADRVLVITSAGCNALDYLLAGAGEVNAVDVNPRQNALLELKSAAIRTLDYPSFWELFGRGRSRQAFAMYHDAIRPALSEAARSYWDDRIHWFEGRGWRDSFYFHGTSGLVAKTLGDKARMVLGLKSALEDLLEARTVERQREVYSSEIRDRLWNPFMRWLLPRSFLMSLLGVPYPQRNEIVTQYPGGVYRFVRDCFEAVITELPFKDNYFWRVYIQGHYEPECCPEYLRPEGYARLRGGLLDRLKIHTTTVTDFLRRTEPGLTKFTLLDHMDWMAFHRPAALVEEWEALLAKTGPGARAIFRSAGLKVSFLDHLQVRTGGRTVELGSLLKYHPRLAAELHPRDRVHTYGSFYIADLPSAV